MTTTDKESNAVVSREDAYDSDVDEAPHAAATFMANLMQIGPSTRQGTSNDTDFHSEVQTYDNHFFGNMNLQVSQEIHGGEQLDSDVDSVIDDHDNIIPYHQYQLNTEVESVSTDVSSVVHGGISMITILDDLRSQLAGHIKTNEEQSFANDSLKAELERYKTQVQNLEQSKVKKDLEQLVFEFGLRWVPTGKIFTSSTTKVDSESTNGSDEDITNQYEYKQTLDVSAGQIGYGRATTPTTPSVSPIEKQLSKLFQTLFDEDKEFPLDVHPYLVNVAPLSAPEIAPDSPSTTTVTKDAPAATTITSPSQTSPPNTGVDGPENTITTSNSESFKNSVTNEFDSEASSSGTVNVNPTQQNNPPIVHEQKWTKDHPLENVIGDLNRPVSTRCQLKTDVMWCFFNEFLENVEPKSFKEAYSILAGLMPCKKKFMSSNALQ
ncbi:hypothetical protein Tco_0862826 [Tanacetum coccineum]